MDEHPIPPRYLRSYTACDELIDLILDIDAALTPDPTMRRTREDFVSFSYDELEEKLGEANRHLREYFAQRAESGHPGHQSSRFSEGFTRAAEQPIMWHDPRRMEEKSG